MEAACKAASRTAQLLTKDTPPEEVSHMSAVMASIREQLSKVSPRQRIASECPIIEFETDNI